MKILVIDDSPFVAKAVIKAVEGTGHSVIGIALNGQIGIDKYLQLKPDVITLDVTMPVMEGLEAAKRLFQLNPNVKIILLSAMGDESLHNEARQIGIKHFLTKPFKPEDLLQRLAEV